MFYQKLELGSHLNWDRKARRRFVLDIKKSYPQYVDWVDVSGIMFKFETESERTRLMKLMEGCINKTTAYIAKKNENLRL